MAATGTAAGKRFLDMLGGFAEFETNLAASAGLSLNCGRLLMNSFH